MARRGSGGGLDLRDGVRDGWGESGSVDDQRVAVAGCCRASAVGGVGDREGLGAGGRVLTCETAEGERVGADVLAHARARITHLGDPGRRDGLGGHRGRYRRAAGTGHLAAPGRVRVDGGVRLEGRAAGLSVEHGRLRVELLQAIREQAVAASAIAATESHAGSGVIARAA